MLRRPTRTTRTDTRFPYTTLCRAASTAGLRPGGMLSSYGASKAGLILLSKVMSYELARKNVRVNVLCPGNIETEMHREFEDAGFTEALVKRIPQRHFGQCGDVAGATLLPASEPGDYMTGHEIGRASWGERGGEEG